MTSKMRAREGDGERRRNPYLIGSKADRKAAHLAALDFALMPMAWGLTHKEGSVLMKVCFERGCNKLATWAMVRPCCKVKDPLCSRHAVAKRNSLSLLARVHDTQEVVCQHCGQKTSQLPTVVEE